MQESPQVSEIAAAKPKTTAGIAVWARDLVIALLFAAFFIVFLYQPVKVEGTSMEPELNDQERIFINKFVYRLGDVERGDIVVFHYPRDPSKSYIKRVIGLPGDTVHIANGHVYVNGQLMSESYVPSRYADQSFYPQITVPAHSFFLLGDHRSSSSDSRDFGPVDQRFIYGKAVFGYWPMEKVGKLR
jgi:signal peptidase I